MALNSAHVGDPAARRRTVGPIAARRSRALVDDAPAGWRLTHDVPAALGRGGFVIERLDRLTLAGAWPLVGRWVRGVARSRP